MRKIVLALCAIAGLGACTTTERVSVQQPGDRAMTCAGLRDEFSKLDEIRRDGQSDQGLNAANVGAALFFWPAAVGNYFTARDAIEIAERRRAHLMAIYDDKNCSSPANAVVTFQVPAYLLAPIGQGMP